MRTFVIAILLVVCTATAYAQPKSPGSDSIDVIRYTIHVDTLHIAAKQLLYVHAINNYV